MIHHRGHGGHRGTPRKTLCRGLTLMNADQQFRYRFRRETGDGGRETRNPK
jgi:hypothetical protein